MITFLVTCHITSVSPTNMTEQLLTKLHNLSAQLNPSTCPSAPQEQRNNTIHYVKYQSRCIRSDILETVTMNSTAFWYMMVCTVVTSNEVLEPAANTYRADAGHSKISALIYQITQRHISQDFTIPSY